MIINDGWMYPETKEELLREFGAPQVGDEMLDDRGWRADGEGGGRYDGSYFRDRAVPYRRRVSESTSPIMNHFI